MHGSTMMFLFAVPVMEGMGIYLVPLMIGTRNVAFPRLNAFGYYLYVFGGLLLYGGFVLNIGPDAGWFSYTPLSGPQFSPGKRIDIWAQMITYTEMSALIVAIEIIVTVLKQRAPGMSLNRIPLFVWAHVCAVVYGDLRHAGHHGREQSCCCSIAPSARTFSTRPREAIRCCISTCSGSSATPRCTLSSSQR